MSNQTGLPRAQEFKPGPLSASQLNAIVNEMLRRITGGPGINVRTFPNGQIIIGQAQTSVVAPRSGLFRMLEEKPDYLVCEGPDPNGTSSLARVYVMKPYELQETPFDGKTIDYGGEQISYNYLSIGARQATKDSEVETQLITPDYYEGTFITAVRVSAASWGLDVINHRTDQEDGNVLMTWIDITPGRAWAVEGDD